MTRPKKGLLDLRGELLTLETQVKIKKNLLVNHLPASHFLSVIRKLNYICY